MTTENITFAAAFLALQQELPAVPKTQENPAFKRSGKAMTYASLNDIVAAVYPVLHKHGFAVSQLVTTVPSATGPVDALDTRLIHAGSGDTLSSIMLLKGAEGGPQKQGSAITYARRYALGSLLGIVTEEDDDGNAASNVTPPKATEAPGLALPPGWKSLGVCDEAHLQLKERIVELPAEHQTQCRDFVSGAGGWPMSYTAWQQLSDIVTAVEAGLVTP